MNNIKEIISLKSKYSIYVIFGLFVFLHLMLFNINSAEWGDSYRILRAAEYVRDFTYPTNEKRPPLFSIFLAFRPYGVDQVLWGRVAMFLFSLASLFVLKRLISFWTDKPFVSNFALLLFVLNPVVFYWSLRIMADVPFMFFTLLAFFLLEKYRVSNKNLWLIFSGLVVGLSISLRFEGYILFGGVGLGVLFLKHTPSFIPKNLLRIVKSSTKEVLIYLASVLATALPYMFFRNPFASSYFEEPSGRTYDLNTLFIYILSLLFAFGFVFALYFIYYGRKSVWGFLQSRFGIMGFLFVELVLALVWPAAIPRLFVAVIPYICYLIALGADSYFSNEKKFSHKNLLFFLAFNIVVLCIYAVGQYFYKLQFLILIKPLFALILVFSLSQIISLYFQKRALFILQFFVISFIWSLATVWIHKDIFKVVQQGNKYIVKNLNGRIGYNDVSSVSNWYLNDSGLNDNVSGTYYNVIDREKAKYSSMLDENIDYLLVTNEHNTDLEIDLKDKPYLEELISFEEEINGKLFFTKILRFNK